MSDQTAVKTAIKTDRAPAAIGPYSQAIRAGQWVFCSGQIPLDPATGTLVPGDIQEQTRRVLENLKAVLAAAGVGMDAVVKTTIYLRDMGDFPKMNETYATYFGGTPPARATVEVSNLPKNARVEIDATAVAG